VSGVNDEMAKRTEPLVYPSWNSLAFKPGITNRQLWAIGMVVVQWSMTEMIVDSKIQSLVGWDKELGKEAAKQRHFQSKLGRGLIKA
jgi:hypothetical protein